MFDICMCTRFLLSKTEGTFAVLVLVTLIQCILLGAVLGVWESSALAIPGLLNINSEKLSDPFLYLEPQLVVYIWIHFDLNISHFCNFVYITQISSWN